MNIVSMVVILTPSVPPIVRAMFTVPNVALQNTMACRVYRLLKLGIILRHFQHSRSIIPESLMQTFAYYLRSMVNTLIGCSPLTGDHQFFCSFLDLES